MNPLERQAALARLRSRIRSERRKRRETDEARAAVAELRGVVGDVARTIEIAIDGVSYQFSGVGITHEEIRAHLSALHEGRLVVEPLTTRKLEGFARDMVPIVGSGGRKRCACCSQTATHHGRASGVAMTVGCSWYVRAWVRDPEVASRMVMRLSSARLSR